jgi:ATP-dependent phosphoenolpyruvate carboxykinase
MIPNNERGIHVSDENTGPQRQQKPRSPLAGPPIDPNFARALDELVALAKQGQKPGCEVYNPPNQWLISHMPIFQDLPEREQQQAIQEVQRLQREAQEANAAGRAATRVWPDVVVRLDNGGLDFFSQLGVVRRPDLTQYFIDGFERNRDALAFSEANQALFAEVFRYISQRMRECFASGKTIIQTDRQIGDAPGRSFHARQLLFGVRYLQVPYMWRQLTFGLPESELQKEPDILEVSIPNWLEDLGLPEDLKARIKEAGLTQLIFKAPTKGMSLHLGFDYAGEHKMGPLSIAMFLVKQNNGLAVQAALSMARAKTLEGKSKNTAMVTIGPSLHGKSTLTIMIELADSDLANLLNLRHDPEEGVYPMNDDIVLLQPLREAIETARGDNRVRISHGIDGTENNFYAVPFGLTRDDDPISYDVLRGTKEEPNSQETLENVPINLEDFTPNYLENPVRNMRMILSRPRLLARKGVQHLMEAITDGQLKEAVHVPVQHTDRVFWQAVMRQNTVIPPLRRLNLEQYIRVLMYGEAVQMGAATGAIGRPYVEYFSDPFIIGLEDENANLMYYILQQMERGGLPQHYYVFNTGGIGAESNEEASGPRYKKITRELTMTLQEALLREAVKFQYDATLGSDIAVAIVDQQGREALDLRREWLPVNIYGQEEYARRVVELRKRRYYGRDDQDKAGILRYTKVTEALMNLDDVPAPANERELAWLLSFHWKVDQAYNSLPELAGHLDEGRRPMPHLLRALRQMYEGGLAQGLKLPPESEKAVSTLGIGEPAQRRSAL